MVNGYVKRGKLSEETINPDTKANSNFKEEIPKFYNHLGVGFHDLRDEIINFEKIWLKNFIAHLEKKNSKMIWESATQYRR